MKVLQEYKEVLWDHINSLGLEDDETAQAMLQAAESYGDGFFELVAHEVEIGECELTGEFGPLAEVAFIKAEQLA
jgi:hypothetical protein